MQRNISITKHTCLVLCLSIGLALNADAADKANAAGVEDASRRTGDEDATGEGMQQTLNLNFSPENREKLRKALDDYARSVDPAHGQIEERRRAMQESIEARFLAIDKDNDGSIDRQEATESLPQVARHFSLVDTNQDEKITLAELQAAQARILERKKAAEAALEAQKLQEADIATLGKRKSKQAVNNSHKRAL